MYAGVVSQHVYAFVKQWDTYRPTLETLDGTIAGAGGWSYRQTIAGAHSEDDPTAASLDATRDPARIRAFYVDPVYARRGVGDLLLGVSDAAALQAGFLKAELTSTLPAVSFYAASGYRSLFAT